VWYGPSVVGCLDDVGLRKVGHRVVARFEEEEGMLAIGDLRSAQAHTLPPTQTDFQTYDPTRR
jgi:hypothetical protein